MRQSAAGRTPCKAAAHDTAALIAWLLARSASSKAAMTGSCSASWTASMPNDARGGANPLIDGAVPAAAHSDQQHSACLDIHDALVDWHDLDREPVSNAKKFVRTTGFGNVMACNRGMSGPSCTWLEDRQKAAQWRAFGVHHAPEPRRGSSGPAWPPGRACCQMRQRRGAPPRCPPSVAGLSSPARACFGHQRPVKALPTILASHQGLAPPCRQPASSRSGLPAAAPEKTH